MGLTAFGKSRKKVIRSLRSPGSVGARNSGAADARCRSAETEMGRTLRF